MATFLHRIGRFAYHRPWHVIAGWVALIAVVAGILALNPPKISNEMRINGTPAQEVIDQLAERMPQSSGGQGSIAFAAPEGQRIDDGANRDAVLAAVDAVSRTDHVLDPRRLAQEELAKGPASPTLSASAAVARAQVNTPSSPDAPQPLTVDGQPVPGVTVSADGAVALYQFQFDKQTAELPTGAVEHTIDAAREAVGDSVGEGGIEVLPSASMAQMPEIVGAAEVIGVMVAAVVLIVTLGSLVAAGLPLVTAFISVAVGVGGTFLFSHFFEMQSMTAVLALMLGLAVGIDYAMFIVNRQRRLILDRGLSAADAAARAIGTAGSAVVFAGMTVVIALVALTVVGISLLTPMALAAAATVVVAVVAAITLLPALLGLVGERIASPKGRHSAATEESNHRFASAWVGAVLRNRVPAALAGIAVTGVIALPALSMTLGMPDGASYNEGTPQRESYDVIAEHYGNGYNGPLVVVAEPAAGGQLTSADIAGTYSDLRRVPGVTEVAFGGVNDASDTAVFSVVPENGPTEEATAQLVRDIRAQSGPLAGLHNVKLSVTGMTAMGIDMSDRLGQAIPVYVAIVMGLSILVLLVVFRSIAVPLKATAGFLLTVFATFGATTALFQWGWFQQLIGLSATGPILSILPIMVIGVLYGLAMDYEVFLVSSMKEAHVHGHRGDDAVAHGFTQASRVVVAAALIMTAVFAGFVFNADPMIKQMGFALAFGVLIDAFVVRMTVVPAVMSMLGDRAWWLPRRMATFLPDLDIEGEKLNRTLERESVPA
ncbi:MMPL family transporter [Mycolicibacterium litorale]|uniref:MMPL family transporter n=1 Tax=Mycolicibacterium litorale TaxID=758802 RepID=UPI0039A14039